MSAAVSEDRQTTQENKQTLSALVTQMQQIMAIISSAITQLSSVAPALAAPQPSDPPETQVGVPEHYDGNAETCGPFLTNYSLLFSLQPCIFVSEQARVLGQDFPSSVTVPGLMGLQQGERTASSSCQLVEGSEPMQLGRASP